MDRLYELGARAVALSVAACIMKCMLPEGSMKRSAEKAVDLAVVAALAGMAAEVIANG